MGAGGGGQAVGASAVVDWLGSVLWDPAVDLEVVPGAVGDLTFLAEPSAARPELLVPAAPAAAVAAVARRSSDARTVPARLRTMAVEAVAAAGLIPRLAPGRLLSVRLGEGSDDPARSLPARLAELLGLPELLYAVTMGGERYNRKPVLTLLDGDGGIVAFAKVGADRFTDELVDNEARWLATIAERAPAGLAAPAVVWSGRWRDRSVLVTSPVQAPRLPVRWSVDRPPPGLVAAIAALAPSRPVPVADSVVMDAVEAVGDDRLDTARSRVLDRHRGTEVRPGAWHGDLSPWNLASRRGLPPLVWDWEAAEAGRPQGADHLHSQVMVATHLRGRSAPEAVERLVPADLGAHQRDDRARAAALDLYLLDVARRDVQIMAGGVAADLLPGIGQAALERLVAGG